MVIQPIVAVKLPVNLKINKTLPTDLGAQAALKLTNQMSDPPIDAVRLRLIIYSRITNEDLVVIDNISGFL